MRERAKSGARTKKKARGGRGEGAKEMHTGQKMLERCSHPLSRTHRGNNELFVITKVLFLINERCYGWVAFTPRCYFDNVGKFVQTGKEMP